MDVTPIPCEKKDKNKAKMEDDSHSKDETSNTISKIECPFCDNSIEVLLNKYNMKAYTKVCKNCRSSVNRLKKELNLEEIFDHHWNSNTKVEIEKIILNHLDFIFACAIRKLVYIGYKEVVAINTVLATFDPLDCNDLDSSIVKKALQYLVSGQKIDHTPRQFASADMSVLVKKVYDAMVAALGDMQPSLGTGDTMWMLLLHDMNLSKALSACYNPVEHDHVTAKLKQELRKRLPRLYAARSSSSSSSSTNPSSRTHKVEDEEQKAKALLEMQELRAQLQDSVDWLLEKIIQVTGRLKQNKPEIEELTMEIIKQREELTAEQESEQESEQEDELEAEQEDLVQEPMEKEEQPEEKSSWCVTELEKGCRVCYKEVDRLRKVARWNLAEKCRMQSETMLAREREVGFDEGYQKALLKERSSKKMIDSLEKYNGKLSQELSGIKFKASKVMPELMSFTKCQVKLEAKWNKENNLKEAALRQAEAKRRELEKIKASGERREEALKFEKEANLRKYCADIEKLEGEIWNSLVDYWKTAQLGWDAGSSSAHSMLIDPRELEMKTNELYLECVMCLTEEASVVFLPCSHQVLCTKCNEEFGEKDLNVCPCCRTPILRRIIARFASAQY